MLYIIQYNIIQYTFDLVLGVYSVADTSNEYVISNKFQFDRRT